MLEIKNLHANINGKEILKGMNLSVKAGEVHANMGPNGALNISCIQPPKPLIFTL